MHYHYNAPYVMRPILARCGGGGGSPFLNPDRPPRALLMRLLVLLIVLFDGVSIPENNAQRDYRQNGDRDQAREYAKTGYVRVPRGS